MGIVFKFTIPGSTADSLYMEGSSLIHYSILKSSLDNCLLCRKHYFLNRISEIQKSRKNCQNIWMNMPLKFTFLKAAGLEGTQLTMITICLIVCGQDN